MPEITVMDIGLPMIDDQHKRLIDLSNGLLQAMVNGMGMDVLEEVFSELKAYTIYHFDAEEQFMEGIGYPGLDEQRACHNRLVAEVERFQERYFNKEAISPSEALDFMNAWIVAHIKEKDTGIADFVRARALGQRHYVGNAQNK